MERRGIPTVSLSNLKARSLMLKLPRVLVTRLPRGMTVGEPNDIAGHLDVLRAALRLLAAPNPEAGWGEYRPASE